MRVIAAIDVLDGKCVRLRQGNYSTGKVYHTNPVEVAREFEAHGIRYLHLVDLDGAREGRLVNHRILQEIATHTNLQVDVGGGIKTTEAVNKAFDYGASQVTGGSIAVSNPTLFIEWVQTFGPDKIILGADCKNRKIATQGWLHQTEMDVIDFIKDYQTKGIRYVISTDIGKDGMLSGPSTELYTDILNQARVQLIASGGVATLEHLQLLKALGCEGAIVGRAIYETTITFEELSTLC
jgi:phosphoribosylformimino-5-aminoimidazole carboxamide ribotide isomerase